jgi:hypothetical protein
LKKFSLKLFISLFICALLCSSQLAAVSPPAALTYDANADFGDSNPNGVWSYGWTAKVGDLPSNLTPYNTYAAFGFGGDKFEGWYDKYNWVLYAPVVYKNYGNYFDDGNVVIPAGALILHGTGSSPDNVSVVEFTAPSAGRYSLSASFIGRQYDLGDPGHVYILYNGTTIFEDSTKIKTVGDIVTYSTILNLRAGEKIDFVVGKNYSIYRDNIELQATIKPVPLPPTAPYLLLLLLD